MLNARAMAHAAATIIAAMFVVCRIVAWISPSFLFALAQSWFHTVSLEPLQTMVSISFGTELLGFVSAVILTWVVTYLTILLYNKWAK